MLENIAFFAAGALLALSIQRLLSGKKEEAAPRGTGRTSAGASSESARQIAVSSIGSVKTPVPVKTAEKAPAAEKVVRISSRLGRKKKPQAKGGTAKILPFAPLNKKRA